MDLEAIGQLKAEAWRTLVAVDHVDAKALDEGLTISQEWRLWRIEVRKVIRGERADIPEEPRRYVDAINTAVAVTTTPEDEIIVSISQPINNLMPETLANLALPDESLADLKTRLLTELTTLRSMAVGQIPMTDEQRAMLTTLEGQVAQQWFTS
jgi:hypothetical protein